MPRPAARSSTKSKSKSPSPAAKSPAAKSQAAKSPAAKSPAAKSQAAKTPKSKTPARSASKKSAPKKSPAPTPASSVPTLDDDDEDVRSSDFDSDDEDMPNWLDYLFYEPDDYATKLALRLNYVLVYANAAFLLLAPAMASADPRMVYLTNMSEPRVRFVGVSILANALCLTAAAQSDFWAQKKALQYQMVFYLAYLVLFVHSMTLTEFSGAKEKFYVFIAVVLAMLGLNLWAWYVGQQRVWAGGWLAGG
jgi:hypothetical protein